jgi:hypothetical protein
MPVIAGLFSLAVIAGRGTLLAATSETVASPSQADQSSLSLTERATDFMNSYWEKVSGNSGEVLAYLGSIYAPL